MYYAANGDGSRAVFGKPRVQADGCFSPRTNKVEPLTREVERSMSQMRLTLFGNRSRVKRGLVCTAVQDLPSKPVMTG